jgi:SulP family sulfate permease
VAGGFQAGIGWLMGVGSIKILTGTTVSLGSLNQLVDSSRSIEHMVPAVLLAAALWFSTRYSKHFFAMLALLLASGPLFYLALAIAGVTTAGAQAHGWLLGPLGGGGFYQPLSASEFHLVSWPAVLAQTGGMATIMIVASTGLLLNVTRLEVAVKHDVDVDQELRILGIGNIVNGIAGGLPGFHSTTASLMAHRIGHGTRLVGIVAAGTAAVVLLLGTSLVAEIPRFIVGGFLLFLGLQLLIQWVVRGWSTMARLDYAVLCAMLIIIGTKGFLVGTLAGVLLAIFLFVITYSRAGVVKHELTGETYQSNVDRSLRQQHVLRERGNSLYILTLQGFLFFGTSTSLLEQIRRRMDSTEQPPVRCMVLDCHLITGVDASLGLVFGKIRQLAIDQGAALALAGVPHSMFRVLRPDSTTDHAETGVQVFPDVDRAVEWAEDRILDEAHAWDEGRPILDQLGDSFQPPELAERVMGYFDRSVITAGDQVVRQGEPSNSLYIVESGKLSVVVETSEGKQVRLRSSTAGALLGELGFFLGTPRTASVVATEPSVLYRLTRESLERMQADDPPVAAAFNAFVTRLLAHRVVATTQTVTQLTA